MNFCLTKAMGAVLRPHPGIPESFCFADLPSLGEKQPYVEGSYLSGSETTWETIAVGSRGARSIADVVVGSSSRGADTSVSSEDHLSPSEMCPTDERGRGGPAQGVEEVDTLTRIAAAIEGHRKERGILPRPAVAPAPKSFQPGETALDAALDARRPEQQALQIDTALSEIAAQRYQSYVFSRRYCHEKM